MPVIRIFAVAAGVLIVMCLVGIVVRSARRLDQKIVELINEDEGGGTIQDPYKALTELYSEDRPEPRS